MSIITTDRLAETMQKEILEELFEMYRATEYSSFDDWMWANLKSAGESLYNYFGNAFGDLDEAAEELDFS